MGNPFGREARRARRELQEQLRSIFRRLDQVETAPVSPGMRLEVEKHVAIQLRETGKQMSGLTGLVGDLAAAGAALTKTVETLTFAVSEGIQRTKRHEDRIHATIKRARKELGKLGYEDPGLEAEAAELRLVDGDGGKDGGLPELPGGMEPPVDAASSIRGVPAATLRRVRGF